AMLAIDGPRRLKIRGRFAKRAGMVRLKIKDSGPGLTQEVRSRVFEPFFTTKPVGSGTGVGLSICRGIVEAHGGVIDVESEPGHGAAFIISLPAIVAEAPAAPASGEPDGGSAGYRVLVIDDEPEILVLLREVLEGDGHRVTTAENGKVALE